MHLVAESPSCVATGMYRCLNEGDTNLCVSEQDRCDGHKNCPAGDDEWYCNITCPDSCQCRALHIDCVDQGLLTVPSVTSDVRSLILSGNTFNLDTDDFKTQSSLGQLDLSYCHIAKLPPRMFQFQKNLNHLDLSNNKIQEILSHSFFGLNRLTNLKLDNNPINVLYEGSFQGLHSLPILILRGMNISELEGRIFEGMSSLTHLDISDSEIMYMHGCHCLCRTAITYIS